MILEMTAPQPQQLTIEPGDLPTKNTLALLRILAVQGWYIELGKRPFIRCLYQSLYKRLIPAVTVSWLLTRNYIAPGSENDINARLWITEAGRNLVNDE